MITFTKETGNIFLQELETSLAQAASAESRLNVLYGSIKTLALQSFPEEPFKIAIKALCQAAPEVGIGYGYIQCVHKLSQLGREAHTYINLDVLSITKSICLYVRSISACEIPSHLTSSYERLGGNYDIRQSKKRIEAQLGDAILLQVKKTQTRIHFGIVALSVLLLVNILLGISHF